MIASHKLLRLGGTGSNNSAAASFREAGCFHCLEVGIILQTTFFTISDVYCMILSEKSSNLSDVESGFLCLLRRTSVRAAFFFCGISSDLD